MASEVTFAHENAKLSNSWIFMAQGPWLRAELRLGSGKEELGGWGSIGQEGGRHGPMGINW